MRAYLIIGGTGTGKTTFIQQQILSRIPNKNCIFIYDVQNEYSHFYNEPFDDFENFIERAALRIRNAVIVLEEATIFANNRTSNYFLRKLLVDKRHTNNFIILAYHSLREIPRYVYDLSNYITLFKTNDSPNLIRSKFEDQRILDMMSDVKGNSNKFYSISLKIY